MENFIFTSYYLSGQGDSHPIFPAIMQFKGNILQVGNKKRNYIAPSSGYSGHLVSEQDTTSPGQSPAQDFFLTFGEINSTLDKCICPLGKVFT